MKKTTVLIILSALTISLNAYVPMLKNGNTWTYLTWSEYSEVGIVTYRTYNYGITGDTTINGTTYYKSDFFSEWLLREDTLLQKVYIYDAECDYEGMLYDFSLNVGDSAEIRYDYTKTIDGMPKHTYNFVDSSYRCTIHIDSIDTFTDLAGNELRLFHYNGYNEKLKKEILGCYAERYGAIDNILNRYVSRTNTEQNSCMLRCFHNYNGELEYKNGNRFDEYLGDDCEGSGEIPCAVKNTTTDEVNVFYDANALTINAEDVTYVEIFTAAGAKIGSYSTSTISLSLTPGIYFARITANGIISTERFVVK